MDQDLGGDEIDFPAFPMIFLGDYLDSSRPINGQASFLLALVQRDQLYIHSTWMIEVFEMHSVSIFIPVCWDDVGVCIQCKHLAGWN